LQPKADPEDHVIVVTGAGGGLGGAMVRGLLAAGRRIVAVDLAAAASGLDALSAAAAELGIQKRLVTINADIRDPAACVGVLSATCDAFGAVGGLVNNAAVGPYYMPDGSRPRFFEVPIERLRRTIETNVTGSFLMARVVGPALLKRGWGRIVNVTTSLGTMTMAGMAPYGPAKGGLEAASALWAHDLENTGVTVNVLVPGGTADTAMVPPFAKPDRSALVPPQVMVDPIVWLTSRASDGVTARRFTAALWNGRATAEENARIAGAPVAWQS
jgi:3-oxoacyl-[acyl-carrier protein] reductase